MQLDMHYYGTYAMARAAGLKEEACRIIATAAQFVDDNAASYHLEFQDGGRIDAQPTAHHVSSVLKNLDPEDQRQVWVPFHFLPGNEGKSFTERLRCRKDSRIARKLIDHHMSYAQQEVGVFLIGVTAHVYLDTFSHHGFSGVSSRRNKVIGDDIVITTKLDEEMEKYVKDKASTFSRIYDSVCTNIKSWLAETGSAALGHGAVATFPDRPYLKWSFRYEEPKSTVIPRNNPKDSLEGCQALHRMFKQFRTASKQSPTPEAVEFARIRGTVKRIIDTPGKKKERVRNWRAAARSGELGTRRFQIPTYDPKVWLQKAAKVNNNPNSRVGLDCDLYRFYQASSMHRQYVLRELLPSEQLVVA